MERQRKHEEKLAAQIEETNKMLAEVSCKTLSFFTSNSPFGISRTSLTWQMRSDLKTHKPLSLPFSFS